MIQIQEINDSKFKGLLKDISKSNLPQAYQYGVAKTIVERWEIKYFLYSNNSGHPLAMMQVLIKRLPIGGAIARLNRGPLLMSQISSDDEVSVKLSALEALLQEGTRRWWWGIQFAPELEGSEELKSRIKGMGCRVCKNPPWCSGRLGLNKSEDKILMGFNGKWRNSMRKGLRLGVHAERVRAVGTELKSLISGYETFQKNNKFQGIDSKIISQLAKQDSKDWQFNLFVAKETDQLQGDPLGYLVTIRHNDCTTYLIGITSEKGRKLQANSVMLWQAIVHARNSGCSWFDVGGFSGAPGSGNSIDRFKKGLNAEEYCLIGEWRWYLFPWLGLFDALLP